MPVQDLFHVTDLKGAEGIKRDGKFRLGCKGFAGAGIYFSAKKDEAKSRCRKNRQVLIYCRVDLGIVVKAEMNEMTAEKCRASGGNSAKVKRHDVYAIYDPARITIFWFQNLHTREKSTSIGKVDEISCSQIVAEHQDIASEMLRRQCAAGMAWQAYCAGHVARVYLAGALAYAAAVRQADESLQMPGSPSPASNVAPVGDLSI